jgi:hypothetical protein
MIELELAVVRVGDLKINNMKIKLPNPNDFPNDVIGFLDQLELCVHHAKKAAEKILAKYSIEDIENGNDTPYMTFASPTLTGEEFDKFDPDAQWIEDIELEIAEI